jgi:hypothetical protein
MSGGVEPGGGVGEGTLGDVAAVGGTLGSGAGAIGGTVTDGAKETLVGGSGSNPGGVVGVATIMGVGVAGAVSAWVTDEKISARWCRAACWLLDRGANGDAGVGWRSAWIRSRVNEISRVRTDTRLRFMRSLLARYLGSAIPGYCSLVRN